ncbi:TIGR04076 family protein [Thermoflexus sp.]|uniref:TIGR04076 family protein n=1 Tax=Thermoflexus sp. TaxID=1969742 RepID=UPI0035E3F57E
MTAGKTLEVRVHEVRGRCTVFQEGDSFHIEKGYRLKAAKPVCMHALASLMPYYVALSRGISPVELGLAREGNAAFVQCLDPCERTGGGTVVFQVTPIGSGDAP